MKQDAVTEAILAPFHIDWLVDRFRTPCPIQGWKFVGLRYCDPMWKHIAIAFGSALLLAGGCGSVPSESDDKLAIFRSTLIYIAQHPLDRSRPQCFQRRMLRASQSSGAFGIVKTSDIYGYIEDEFFKIMRRCSNENVSAGYAFTEPEVDDDLASIKVDYVCGPLCGQGVTYRLRRTNDPMGWEVTSKAGRWIS